MKNRIPYPLNVSTERVRKPDEAIRFSARKNTSIPGLKDIVDIEFSCTAPFENRSKGLVTKTKDLTPIAIRIWHLHGKEHSENIDDYTFNFDENGHYLEFVAQKFDGTAKSWSPVSHLANLANLNKYMLLIQDILKTSSLPYPLSIHPTLVSIRERGLYE